jgi:serine/threonine protein kinase
MRVQHFSREAVSWQLLRHPNVVPFLGILRSSSPDDPLYLVSIWMEHGRLTQFIVDNPEEDPLSYVGTFHTS